MYRRIMMPVDGSDLAEQVVPHVEALSKVFGAHVTVLWATGPVPTVAGVAVASEERWQAEDNELAGPYLERVLKRLLAGGVDAVVERAKGVPAKVILEQAASSQVDLIAMMTHGRSGIKRLALGSVAEEVVRHAECPVLLVRAR